MNKEHEQKLIEKYPLILQNTKLTVRESCLAFGIETGDGWYDLLDRLMGALQWDTDKNGYPQVVADQIKEKFGTLSFYYHTEGGDLERCSHPIYNTYHRRVIKVLKFIFPFLKKYFEYDFKYECGEIDGVIKFAQRQSGHICEHCGEPGTCESNMGWVSTQCKSCRKPKATVKRPLKYL